MSKIIDIDQYIYSLAFPFSSFNCQNFKDEFQRVLNNQVNIEDGYDNSKVKVSDQKLDYHLPPLSSNNVEPLVIVGGTFKNTADIPQEFESVEIEKKTINSTTTSITEGYKFGSKLGSSTTVKAEIPFVGGAETTISIEVSFESDFSQTEEKTITEEMSIKIPPQKIIVAPGQTKRLEIELYKVKVPPAKFIINGDVSGTVASGILGGDIYEKLSAIEKYCPKSYVNVNEDLQLNTSKKTLHFKGEGQAKFEIFAFEYVMRVITIDNKTGSPTHEVNTIRQLSNIMNSSSTVSK
ncbi:ETX/MTX2 family pore-forming toxin [Bacillus cereus]|uniref:ETX/MTX2 family pore-forming toxin n=1 Tax=Bacillus cereus TaxID=1396 RepID=UPI002A08F03F|nr:ETX/MTX2 family pore-forming toxin [Bacillus cereus]